MVKTEKVSGVVVNYFKQLIFFCNQDIWDNICNKILFNISWLWNVDFFALSSFNTIYIDIHIY